MNTRRQHAVLFQALGHPVRLQILEILSQGPICVCDLVALTGQRQPCISQHLAALRSAELVITERQGWSIFYRLNDARLAELEQVVSMLLPIHKA
jgi:DNA-binding transcriptional ArsR family regulator